MKKNSIVYFSDASMLAIHALTLLAKEYQKKDRSFITTKEIASILGASENHLAKIMQILNKNKYVNSVKGPSGGFILIKKPEEISIKEIIELIEGPVEANFCPFFKNCTKDKCILGSEINDYAEKIISILEKKNISEVADKSIF